MSKSYLERITEALIKDAGLPMPEAEFRFCDEKRWRADFVWKEQMVLLECEGGIWTNGRHVRGYGFQSDCEKYNEASLLGWTVLRVTHLHIKNGQMITWLKRALKV